MKFYMYVNQRKEGRIFTFVNKDSFDDFNDHNDRYISMGDAVCSFYIGVRF